MNRRDRGWLPVLVSLGTFTVFMVIGILLVTLTEPGQTQAVVDPRDSETTATTVITPLDSTPAEDLGGNQPGDSPVGYQTGVPLTSQEVAHIPMARSFYFNNRLLLLDELVHSSSAIVIGRVEGVTGASSRTMPVISEVVPTKWLTVSVEEILKTDNSISDKFRIQMFGFEVYPLTSISQLQPGDLRLFFLNRDSGNPGWVTFEYEDQEYALTGLDQGIFKLEGDRAIPPSSYVYGDLESWYSVNGGGYFPLSTIHEKIAGQPISYMSQVICYSIVPYSLEEMIQEFDHIVIGKVERLAASDLFAAEDAFGFSDMEAEDLKHRYDLVYEITTQENWKGVAPDRFYYALQSPDCHLNDNALLRPGQQVLLFVNKYDNAQSVIDDSRTYGSLFRGAFTQTVFDLYGDDAFPRSPIDEKPRDFDDVPADPADWVPPPGHFSLEHIRSLVADRT